MASEFKRHDRNATRLPEGALTNQVAVVTGASDGIGRVTSLELARAGATVVMVGRNEAKTRAAASAIMSALGRRAVSTEIADLSVQEEVRALALRLRTNHPRIDVLVNNAGGLFMERTVTREQLERTFALNHLAYFTLSLLLFDRLIASSIPGKAARIINVSSRAHVRARLRLDDLQSERSYSGWGAYANSKLCNVLFTRALARRVDKSRLVVHALHPGLVSTRFATNNGTLGRLMRRIMNVASITPEEGADTMIWLSGATEPTQSTGEYWVRRQRVKPSAAARDDALGEALWNSSATLARLNPDDIIRESKAAAR